MNTPLEHAQLLGKIWMDFATRMTSAGLAFRPDETPPEAARDVRGAMFRAMGEASDQFMRSPAFLQMMKQSLDASLNFRKQYNDLLTRLHHDAQGVARQDVDSLLQSVRHLEGRVLDTLELVEARLTDIAARLERLEHADSTSAGGSNGSGQRPATTSTTAGDDPAGGSHA